MTHDSRIERYEILAAAAAVGAHSNAVAEGFRQRDFLFLFELFSNWTEGTLEQPVVPLQNTQAARYLAELCQEGYARRLNRKGHPRFRLTRIGLLELISRCVNRSPFAVPAHFFFCYYFVSSYRQRIEELVAAEGRQFPSALRVELQDLLRGEALLQRETAAVEKELKFADECISDVLKASSWTRARLKEGKAFPAVAREVERLFPYQLNSQKPLSELLASIPEQQQPWELEVGGQRRVRCIFQPKRLLLRSYLQTLRDLVEA